MLADKVSCRVLTHSRQQELQCLLVCRQVEELVANALARQAARAPAQNAASQGGVWVTLTGGHSICKAARKGLSKQACMLA
jgi:hypothetical protein